VTGADVNAAAPLPPEVRSAIATALAAVDASPDGWLDLPARRRLRAAFGPWTPWREPDWPDAGILRRAALLSACVERALPVWEAAQPDDHRPREVLALSRAALWHGAPEEPLRAVARSFRETVEPMGLVDRGYDEAVFYAGMAAYRLSIDAFDGDLDPEFHPPEASEFELDEPPVEALAARALGGWDAEALRAFWRWYVTEAFPAAYRAAP
jgi:hypothetical protein